MYLRGGQDLHGFKYQTIHFLPLEVRKLHLVDISIIHLPLQELSLHHQVVQLTHLSSLVEVVVMVVVHMDIMAVAVELVEP